MVGARDNGRIQGEGDSKRLQSSTGCVPEAISKPTLALVWSRNPSFNLREFKIGFKLGWKDSARSPAL